MNTIFIIIIVLILKTILCLGLYGVKYKGGNVKIKGGMYCECPKITQVDIFNHSFKS